MGVESGLSRGFGFRSGASAAFLTYLEKRKREAALGVLQASWVVGMARPEKEKALALFKRWRRGRRDAMANSRGEKGQWGRK